MLAYIFLLYICDMDGMHAYQIETKKASSLFFLAHGLQSFVASFAFQKLDAN